MRLIHRVRPVAAAIIILAALTTGPGVSWAGDVVMTLTRVLPIPGESSTPETCRNIPIISVDAKVEAVDDDPTGSGMTHPLIKVVKKVDACSPSLRRAFGSNAPFDQATFVIERRRETLTIEARPAVIKALEITASKRSFEETIMLEVGGVTFTP